MIKRIRFYLSILCIIIVLAGIWGTGTASMSVYAASKGAEEDTAEETEEFRAVWIAYSNFDAKKYSNRNEFAEFVGEMFDNAVNCGMNAVVVHVRPFSDAMYQSDYFPWSKYASGKQGVHPGFDPLRIMVEEAHVRGLQIHAWLNPYRVTAAGNTDPMSLSKKNPARKYLTNSKKKDDRYVLAYHDQLFYNPSVPAVRKLIINGVKEIVQYYDVDGIHFDDYFYPAFSEETYTVYFDAPEYEEYVAKQTAKGKSYKDIVAWRKGNVNTLVSGVYKAIKEIDPDCVFGISPGGYIDYYKNDYFRWYVDYQTWMSKPGYIDYICPQIYWSFNTLNTYPYYETLLKWEAALKTDAVKLYVGLPAYKMNEKVKISSASDYYDSEWFNQFTLANMVRVARSTERTSGFIVFDYQDFTEKKNEKAINNLKAVWDE